MIILISLHIIIGNILTNIRISQNELDRWNLFETMTTCLHYWTSLISYQGNFCLTFMHNFHNAMLNLLLYTHTLSFANIYTLFEMCALKFHAF